MTFENIMNNLRCRGKHQKVLRLKMEWNKLKYYQQYTINISLEDMLREIKINQSGKVKHKGYQYLAYADDVVIIATKQEDLIKTVNRFEASARKAGRNKHNKNRSIW